jgi:protein involved in temperature-dependent protein secretion
MNAKELLREAKVAEALTELQHEIRANPTSGLLRIFLFQLCCVTGSLDRALNQLQVAAGFDPESEMLARIFKQVIECELYRRRVFEGIATPLVFGEPEEALGAANCLKSYLETPALGAWRDKMRPDGTFVDEAVARGVALTVIGATAANMGVAWGDVDGDGLQDI